MLELTIEDPHWAELGLSEIAHTAVSATLSHLGLEAEDCEISMLACDDEKIKILNREFRDKPTATNVLSWPAVDLSADEPGGNPMPPEPDFMGELVLGDIAIAWETCAREAEAGQLPIRNHVTHLVVHGLLHLLGYDHIHDQDAALMEGLEARILGKLGVDNPYRERDGSA
ncbi:MAG: rRNA maturation RNase YbeY [Rhodobacteraceae bacterium]|nr:rRNA maturation RNase YbeY [Paracoccaceae bacterium]